MAGYPGGIPSTTPPFTSARTREALFELDQMFLTVFGSLDPEARTALHARVRADPAFGYQPPPVLAHATEAASTLASLRFASPRVPRVHPPPPSPGAPAPADGPSGGGIAKTRKHISVKHYADAVPSKHCHVCCRSAKNVAVYPCARIKEGICRKVVCVRCFAENGWAYEKGWTCCHCRGVCPKRGQCFTYGRSNLRRRQQTIRKQMEIAADKQKQQMRQVAIPPMAP